MVFMGERRTELREDSVAGGLHDVTVVAVDRVDHELQRRIDDRPRFLGIEICYKFGRALDVCEKRRDGLALAVEDRRVVCFPDGNGRI
jgi:hypothetical protein